MVGRMLTLENNDSTIGDPWLTNYTEQYIIGKKDLLAFGHTSVLNKSDRSIVIKRKTGNTRIKLL